MQYPRITQPLAATIVLTILAAILPGSAHPVAAGDNAPIQLSMYTLQQLAAMSAANASDVVAGEPYNAFGGSEVNSEAAVPVEAIGRVRIGATWSGEWNADAGCYSVGGGACVELPEKTTVIDAGDNEYFSTSPSFDMIVVRLGLDLAQLAAAFYAEATLLFVASASPLGVFAASPEFPDFVAGRTSLFGFSYSEGNTSTTFAQPDNGAAQNFRNPAPAILWPTADGIATWLGVIFPTDADLSVAATRADRPSLDAVVSVVAPAPEAIVLQTANELELAVNAPSTQQTLAEIEAASPANDETVPVSAPGTPAEATTTAVSTTEAADTTEATPASVLDGEAATASADEASSGSTAPPATLSAVESGTATGGDGAGNDGLLLLLGFIVLLIAPLVWWGLRRWGRTDSELSPSALGPRPPRKGEPEFNEAMMASTVDDVNPIVGHRPHDGAEATDDVNEPALAGSVALPPHPPAGGPEWTTDEHRLWELTVAAIVEQQLRTGNTPDEDGNIFVPIHDVLAALPTRPRDLRTSGRPNRIADAMSQNRLPIPGSAVEITADDRGAIIHVDEHTVHVVADHLRGSGRRR